MDKLNLDFPETSLASAKWQVVLWRFWRPELRRLAVAIVFFAIKHSPVWLLPVITGAIINVIALPGQSLDRLWLYLGLMLLVLAQNVPTHMAFSKLFYTANRNTEMRLRGAIIRRLQQLSMSFHDQAQSGRLQSKVLRDVEAVQVLCNTFMIVLVPGVLGLIFAIVWTLCQQPMMAAFFLVAVPAAMLMRHFFGKPLNERNRQFRQNVEEMSGQVLEMIDMIPVARAHGVEEQELCRVEQKLREVKHRGYRLDMLNNIFGCSSWVAFGFFRTACLGTSAYLAWRGMIRPGDVMMYQGFFEIILVAVQSMLNSYPMITAGAESVKSISEVLLCPDIERNEGKPAVQAVRGQFEFQNVSFRYPGQKTPAVDSFNLSVSPGESIALVGESGAGKSTLMSLLIGFHRPTSGRILLDGVDMEKLDLRTYRRFLAVVPQNTLLTSGSIRENVSYGLQDVDDRRVWAALEAANAAQFVREMPNGLETTIGENGSRLSGGQRQRIAIARAMVRDPKVIILDEATSALDAASEQQVQEALWRLIRGRTTFIVAHRLSTVRDCARIVVMRDGRCVESGSHDELLVRKSDFYRLKTLQA